MPEIGKKGSASKGPATRNKPFVTRKTGSLNVSICETEPVKPQERPQRSRPTHTAAPVTPKAAVHRTQREPHNAPNASRPKCPTRGIQSTHASHPKAPDASPPQAPTRARPKRPREPPIAPSRAIERGGSGGSAPGPKVCGARAKQPGRLRAGVTYPRKGGDPRRGGERGSPHGPGPGADARTVFHRSLDACGTKLPIGYAQMPWITRL
jgi:hypothetical protein